MFQILRLFCVAFNWSWSFHLFSQSAIWSSLPSIECYEFKRFCWPPAGNREGPPACYRRFWRNPQCPEKSTKNAGKKRRTVELSLFGAEVSWPSPRGISSGISVGMMAMPKKLLTKLMKSRNLGHQGRSKTRHRCCFRFSWALQRL